MAKGSALYNPVVQTDLDMLGHHILNCPDIGSVSGYSGYSGKSGYSGYSGYCGLSGYSGYSGSGVSGYSGWSGYSGISGYSGFSGKSGFSGFSGYSGYSGQAAGQSGFSGYSGFSGWSGFSGVTGGTSGFSGYSGFSGWSGWSGYSAAPDILQNSQSADYTTVIGDDGKHILHPSGDNNPRTFTIAAQASVNYPVGACITFVNKVNIVTIAVGGTDTLTLANTSMTGNRSLALNGIATAIKINNSTPEWLISGTGIS